MGIIKQLPEDVVSKIAAGEVIERPAFALKELIENSLDAKATSVRIEVKESGLEKIAVYDNGEGMSKDDLMLSFLPHTTSKIKTENDLTGIKSLGFRGEALSSIASISELTIKSKRENDKLGTKITVKASQLVNSSSVGMTNGTAVEIKNLFFSVPARKKFMRAPRTEYRHLLDVVTKFSLAYPTHSFYFSHNDKEIFHFNTQSTLEERLKTLFGETIYNSLLPLTFQDSYISIKGFVSHPQVSHSSTKHMYFYVNGRYINDSLIARSIKDAYSSLLELSSYPFVVLFISLPHQLLDVNVHPRKEIIKFFNQDTIYNAVKTSVEQSLKSHNLTFFNISWKGKTTKSNAASSLKNVVLSTDIATIGKIKKTADVTQLHSLYLVTETKNGILLIDQHAAHEAILYRNFKEEFVKEHNKGKSLSLPKSLLISVSLSEADLLRDHIEIFEKIGFVIEEFGDNVFKINKIPKVLAGLDIKSAITEMLDDLHEERQIQKVGQLTNKMLSYLACRSAIKQGQKLSKKDVKKIVNHLEKEDFIYTCPHGRPVKIELTLSHLNKLFKRK